jgi:EpsI family protein
MKWPGNTTLSVGLIILALVAYWPSTAALWDFWTDANHGGMHGPLVAAISAWLLFRARNRLDGAAVRPSFLAGALLVICSVMWLVFWRAGIQELYILLLPLLMGLAVLASLGFEAALQLVLPIGFLYFAVPAWGILILPLQALTVHAVGVFAPLIDIPAQIQGNLVRLPGVGVFEIAGGCSGVNFLTVGLALAVLVGEIERGSLARRAFLVGALGALAVISNWIRVLVIIDAGYTTNMRHVLVSRGHYWFGWALFTTVITVFVWLAMRARTETSVSEADAASAVLPVRMKSYIAAAIALIMMPLGTYAIAASLDSGISSVVFAAPPGHAGWQGPVTDGPADNGHAWNPVFVGPHSQWHVSYASPSGRSVEIVAIAYSSQAQGRELVSSENSLLGTDSADSVADGTVKLGSQSYIETLTTDAHGRRSIVWSVYDIGGRQFVTPLMSQLWYGLRSLGGPPYSVLFAFRAACEGSCDAARDTLKNFVKTMGPDFPASVNREPRSSQASRSV